MTALFYHKIRLVIEYNLNLEAQTLFDGEIGLMKVILVVSGLLKRNGNVFVVVKDIKTDTLMPIITSKIKPDGIYIQTATKATMLLM